MGIKEELETKFKERNIQVTLYPDPAVKQFATLQEFHEFLVKEREFWSECREGETDAMWSCFNTAVTQNERAFQNPQVEQAYDLLSQTISLVSQNKFPAVFSSTAIAQLIKNKFKEKYQYGDAICHYLLKEPTSVQNIRTKEYFEGYLFAFLATKFDGAMAGKVEAEANALSDLRTRFTDELNALHKDYLARGEACTQKSSEIDGNYKTFCQDTLDWRKGIQDNADTFLKDKRQELEDLKKLYNEKLRLEGPATYWESLADEYQAKGKTWRTWLMVSSSLFVLFLTVVLFNLPDALFPGKGISITGFKSTVLLTFIASVGVYVIHYFVKMSMSAYHMARDAKERYQLTHVYLSLMHEGAVNAEERIIVLQSIFTRADTGLLKGDSGSGMPDAGIASLIAKNIKPPG